MGSWFRNSRELRTVELLIVIHDVLGNLEYMGVIKHLDEICHRIYSALGYWFSNFKGIRCFFIHL